MERTFTLFPLSLALSFSPRVWRIHFTRRAVVVIVFNVVIETQLKIWSRQFGYVTRNWDCGELHWSWEFHKFIRVILRPHTDTDTGTQTRMKRKFVKNVYFDDTTAPHTHRVDRFIQYQPLNWFLCPCDVCLIVCVCKCIVPWPS